jgi:hypothetical protein
MTGTRESTPTGASTRTGRPAPAVPAVPAVPDLPAVPAVPAGAAVPAWRAATALDERQAERIAWLRMVVALVGCVAAIVLTHAVALAADRFHWWADFVLVPGALVAAAGLAMRAGPVARFTVGWLGLIIFSTGVLLMTGGMGAGWPLMIIVPCLGPLALYAMRPADPSLRSLLHTVAGLAGLGVLLGGAFFAIKTGRYEPGRDRWWVGFMLAASVVPAGYGLALLARRRGVYWYSTAVLLLALGGFTILAALREHGR